jgi:two-component system, sensor histidine kinase and response regulator
MANLRPANVLIVDDRPENLIATEAILEDLGEPVYTASSGEEALKLLLQHDFAVILLDVQMGGLDGFDTATLIKQREKSRHTPIIFVTAINRSEEHVSKGYNVGAVDYLFKPIVPEILKSKVRVFIDLFRMNQEIQEQAAHIEANNQELETQLQEIQRLNQKTEALNKELEAFSYSVSHDLRAPLRSINGFSQALWQDYYDGLDEQGQHYLQRIRVGCKRMTEIIDDLLQLSRLSQQKLHIGDVNLSEMVSNIVEERRGAQPERQVTTTIQPGLVTRGDSRLLKIALENLVGNAWKFTANEAEPLIEFGCSDDDGTPVYFVRDNGAGFDMAFADQLFLPFQRLHLDTEFEGSGIGLATVHRVIRRHEGRIWAKAQVSEGAVFYFTLSNDADI